MIESGNLVFSGSMEDFDNYIAPESFVVEFLNPPSIEILKGLANSDKIESISDNRFRIFFDSDCSITEKFIDESVKQNWRLNELLVERSTLDEIFAQLSGKSKK